MKKNILIIMEIYIIMMSFYYQNMINFTNIDLYILLALLLVLFSNTKNMKSDKIINSFSIFFAILFSFGNLNIESFNCSWPFIILIQILGFSFVFRRLFLVLNKYIKKIKVDDQNKRISAFKFITISSIIGFLLLLPYFLRFYPGIMTNDSFAQIWQARGYLDYSNHHPWIHTLIIKFFYSIGYHLTNDPNKGVAFYSLFQMVIASLSFSYVTYTLYKNNVKKYLVLLVWLFLFLLPFNAIYSIIMWKDIIFSYIILVFSVFIWDHYYNNLEWNKKRNLIFILLSFFTCLMRSNGLIAYLLFILFLIFFYRKEFFKTKWIILISLILVFLFKIPVMNFYKVTSPDFVESLSIPAQQIAYVIKNDGNISKSEKKQLSKIVDIKKIKKESNLRESYIISNSIKWNIRGTGNLEYLEKNKIKYLKLWIKIGIKNPEEYIKAYVIQTSGYWYHNFGRYWVYMTTISTSYEEAKVDLYQTNLLNKSFSTIIDKLLEHNSSIYYQIWSPAITIYVIIVSLFIAIKKRNNIIPYTFTISLWLTVLIATPVACEFRYVYSLFISFPVLLLIAFKNNTSQSNKEDVILETKKN